MNQQNRRLGVVMDPISSIKPVKDSTLAMLLEAQARGWEIRYMEQADLWVRDGHLRARTRGLTVRDDKTDWFDLQEAQSQLPPVQWPGPEIAVASAISPSGASAAGRHGIGLLSLAASGPEGYEQLPKHWQVCEETAAKFNDLLAQMAELLGIPGDEVGVDVLVACPA